MWEIPNNNADWDCSKALHLLEFLKTLNQPHEDFCFCKFGGRTFVPASWMWKKETSVSHSSTEAAIIFLDAGLRMGGIPALDLRDLVIEVFHSLPNQANKA